MNLICKTLPVVLALVAGFYSVNPARAEDAGDRTIEQYKCKDVMRDSGSNRDVAIAFLLGFLTGKSGSSKFNVADLHKATNAFIERCLDNPNEKAVDIMVSVR